MNLQLTETTCSLHQENISQPIKTRVLTLKEEKLFDLAISTENQLNKRGCYYDENDSVNEGKWIFKTAMV